MTRLSNSAANGSDFSIRKLYGTAAFADRMICATPDKIHLVDAKKLTPATHDALSKVAVIASEGSVETVLATLGKAGTQPAQAAPSQHNSGKQWQIGERPQALTFE